MLAAANWKYVNESKLYWMNVCKKCEQEKLLKEKCKNFVMQYGSLMIVNAHWIYYLRHWKTTLK